MCPNVFFVDTTYSLFVRDVLVFCSGFSESTRLYTTIFVKSPQRG
jgi:hypothetical protein